MLHCRGKQEVSPSCPLAHTQLRRMFMKKICCSTSDCQLKMQKTPNTKMAFFFNLIGEPGCCHQLYVAMTSEPVLFAERKFKKKNPKHPRIKTKFKGVLLQYHKWPLGEYQPRLPEMMFFLSTNNGTSLQGLLKLTHNYLSRAAHWCSG